MSRCSGLASRLSTLSLHGRLPGTLRFISRLAALGWRARAELCHQDLAFQLHH